MKEFNELEHTFGGRTRAYCTNNGYCASKKGVKAWTTGAEPLSSFYCPLFFKGIPEKNERLCGVGDRAGVLMHELSHVFAYTKDWEYGVRKSKALPAWKALENADTYMFYAKGKFRPWRTTS